MAAKKKRLPAKIKKQPGVVTSGKRSKAGAARKRGSKTIVPGTPKPRTRAVRKRGRIVTSSTHGT